METLRHRKKKAQEALWQSLTPEERLQRASELTASALELREAGAAYLGARRRSRRSRPPKER